MKLGAFSISLSVKDLQASKAFYEKLGFSVFGGSEEMNYLIMKNEQTLIGLLHEMFEKNILTFNNGEGPGSILFFDPDGNGILIDQHI
jgi:predicted lactoylglutathione lyase